MHTEDENEAVERVQELKMVQEVLLGLRKDVEQRMTADPPDGLRIMKCRDKLLFYFFFILYL